VGGVQYCPNAGYQTCSIDVPNYSLGLVQQRYFCLSQPNVAQANAVFMFHGAGHTGNAVAKHWQNQTSDSFIILPAAEFVSGTRKWNTVNIQNPHYQALETVHGHSDTRFIKTILEELDSIYSCNQAAPPVPCINNYYAAGFSSGAAMVLQLLTRNEFSYWFSGYGAVSNYLDDAKKAPQQVLPNGNKIGNINDPFTPRPIAFMMGTDERMNLPIKPMISVVENGCANPSLIYDALYCFSSLVDSTFYANRLDTAMWLRNRSSTVNPAITTMYDNPTDDTLISSQLYLPDAAVNDAVAVWVGTVINGGHSWPSINNLKSDPNHSEDIETSDVLVDFWTDFADW